MARDRYNGDSSGDEDGSNSPFMLFLDEFQKIPMDLPPLEIAMLAIGIWKDTTPKEKKDAFKKKVKKTHKAETPLKKKPKNKKKEDDDDDATMGQYISGIKNH